MKQYLATLHTRSDRHKNGFALAASGLVSLSIFAIWFFVNFREPVVAIDTDPRPQLASAQEVSPFESISSSFSSAWAGLRENWGELNRSIRNLNLESSYNELKEKTLDAYGPVRSNE